MKILGIESSCDETAAAVIEDGRKICSSVIHTQVEEHKLYGGVVPEIASRRHIESICGVTAEALERAGLTAREVDAVAVTAAPGLIGAVLVGVNFAKGLALSAEKPLIPVHHIRGHVAANYLAHPELEPPFLALIVSGGHSHIVLVRDYCDYTILGRTTDDAAGEAFDKCAKVMGLPYPGGPVIDKLAKEGDPKAFRFARPHVDGYDYSFSGLKTSFLYTLRDAVANDPGFIENNKASLCASLQKTIVEILLDKLVRASKDLGIRDIAIAGGVSANSGLRNGIVEEGRRRGWRTFLPEFKFTTDNAAMIAMAGYYRYQHGDFSSLGVSPVARLQEL